VLGHCDHPEAITRIYNEGVRGRGVTFEALQTPYRRWRSGSTTRVPILFAEADGLVVGWAGASGYRAREGAAGIAVYSISEATSQHGRGIGNGLMPPFLAPLERAGFCTDLSRLFPADTVSRALCTRFGFREVGIYERHRRLDGECRDAVTVGRLLGVAFL
jgi:L-amino acid N-acyltransferase YncA